MRLKHCALLLAAIAGAGTAAADTFTIDFENPPYSLGTINNQDGWKALGSAGSGCALYDVAVAANTSGFASFGSQSLRDSNARTSGCFGDQTFSKSLSSDAGESTATGDGMTTGVRQSHFEAQWDFISKVPGAQQAGLSVVASPDRGDGARMSWVQMTDTPAGIDVNFYEYIDNAPFGPGDVNANTFDDGCDDEDDFYLTNVATGLDRTIPHAIKITMDFVEGPANDIVKVYVDGVLGATGTSWEDYFRYCEGNPTRPVDSILFRTGGTPALGTLGNGFLIDNLRLSSSARPVRIDVRPGSTQNQINPRAQQLVPIAILAETDFDPTTEVDIDSVRVRNAKPVSTKSDSGDVDGDGLADLTLFFRARQMDPPTPAECADPNAMIELTGNTTDGSAFKGTDRVTWSGC